MQPRASASWHPPKVARTCSYTPPPSNGPVLCSLPRARPFGGMGFRVRSDRKRLLSGSADPPPKLTRKDPTRPPPLGSFYCRRDREITRQSHTAQYSTHTMPPE